MKLKDLEEAIRKNKLMADAGAGGGGAGGTGGGATGGGATSGGNGSSSTSGDGGLQMVVVQEIVLHLPLTPLLPIKVQHQVV